MKRLLVGLLLGANLCTILALWLCCLSTFVSPSIIPRLSSFGLMFPFLLIANMAFILFWLIFHTRLVWVPAVGILLTLSYIMDYCPLRFGKEATTDSCLCIMNYNCGGIKATEGAPELAEYIKLLAPDVVCLQEIYPTILDREEHHHWIDSMGYKKLVNGTRTTLVRHPILGEQVEVSFPTVNGGNGSLACWIEVRGDSVLIVNNHLESNKLTVADKDEYKKMIRDHQKEQAEQAGRLLMDKLAEAAKFRGGQTDSLCHLVERFSTKSLILCGDFNDTPISYTYQQLARHMGSSFREKGHGIGVSINQQGFYVRIDHLFHSSDWETVRCYVDGDVDLSDHFPLITYLHKKRR